LAFSLGLLHQKRLEVGYQIDGLIPCLRRQLLIKGNDVLADTTDVFSETGIEVILDGVVRPTEIS
jgi:hypothetical protein